MSALGAFNTQLIRFFQELKETFPEEKDIRVALEAIEAMKKTTVVLGDGSYKVQQVRTDVIGGLTRVDSTEPAYWGQVDVVTLWLTPA